MEISRGHTRTVLVFENVVFKLPRIYFWRFLKSLYHAITKDRFIHFISKGIGSSLSPWRMLSGGIICNWREYVYCRNLQSPFLQKTYVSIFGLLNIQKKGERLTIQDVDLWCQLVEMTDEEVWADGHTFSNTNNFCNANGHLKMIDYGNNKIFDVLKKHGNKIFNDFDFSYSWEERKKELYKDEAGT